MITNNIIKELKSLSASKYRQKYNKFLVEGDKSCDLFIQSPRYKVLEVIALPEWLDNNPIPHEIICYEVDKRTMKKISNLHTPSAVAMTIELEDNALSATTTLPGRSIYLDGIQNPGNVGTIIRLADWFGFTNVIRNDDTADFYSPKVVQASMGSITGINLYSGNHTDIINRELPLITADLDGVSLTSYSFPETYILVMGNEGHGISSTLKSHISETITIDGRAGKQAESLNVAIACGIICHHAHAQ